MGRTVTGVIDLRPMAKRDLAAVEELEVAIFPQPWSASVFRDELRQPRRFYLVAEDEGGSLAGYAGLLWIDHEAHITTIAVAPPFRGRGIGTKLMIRLIEEALGRGARHLTLEVRVSNQAAQALYRRFGLAPVGVRKSYYGNEDALVMWVHDIDSPAYRRRLDELRGDGHER